MHLVCSFLAIFFFRRLLSNQFSILLAGYNVRIYAMDLTYDAVYRMYLIGEFELPKSNISLCLVENALHEIGSLKVNLTGLLILLLIAKLSTSCCYLSIVEFLRRIY